MHRLGKIIDFSFYKSANYIYLDKAFFYWMNQNLNEVDDLIVDAQRIEEVFGSVSLSFSFNLKSYEVVQILLKKEYNESFINYLQRFSAAKHYDLKDVKSQIRIKAKKIDLCILLFTLQ